MKITETIERECCQRQDRKPFRGQGAETLRHFKPEFCIHCGQIWVETKGELDCMDDKRLFIDLGCVEY